MKKDYYRDGRAPVPLKESISRAMSSNKARNTKPEIALRVLLWGECIKGYRLNWKNAPGKPDIAFPGRKIAIFVNGCFWHRCPYCKPSLPKTHKRFWNQKFTRNAIRDKENNIVLRKNGWKVLTIWECQIEKYPNKTVGRVKKLLLAK